MKFVTVKLKDTQNTTASPKVYKSNH